MDTDNIDTLDLEEAAEYLKVSTNTVKNLMNSGRIESAKIGERLVFFKADLAQYIRSVMREQSQERMQGVKVKSEVSKTRRPELPTMEQITGSPQLVRQG